MSTIGFISDVHGNLTALETVLDDMPDVDSLVCLGDVVGYGPYPAECVERIRKVASVCLVGNHELALLNGYSDYSHHEMAYEGFKHADAELSTAQKEWLATLPELTTAVGGLARIVHSHPDPDTRWTRDGYIGRAKFTEVAQYLEGGEGLLAFGHTHDQYVVDMRKYQSQGVILNPGSVGQPRDNDERAAYATVTVDDEQQELLGVETHRVEYDIERVQQDIKTAGLPQRTGDRLADGK